MRGPALMSFIGCQKAATPSGRPAEVARAEADSPTADSWPLVRGDSQATGVAKSQLPERIELALDLLDRQGRIRSGGDDRRGHGLRRLDRRQPVRRQSGQWQEALGDAHRVEIPCRPRRGRRPGLYRRQRRPLLWRRCPVWQGQMDLPNRAGNLQSAPTSTATACCSDRQTSLSIA